MSRQSEVKIMAHKLGRIVFVICRFEEPKSKFMYLNSLYKTCTKQATCIFLQVIIFKQVSKYPY